VLHFIFEAATSQKQNLIAKTLPIQAMQNGIHATVAAHFASGMGITKS